MKVVSPVSAPDPWCKASRHGTRTAYVKDKCRCTSARLECARYENERTLDRLHGRPRTIDATGTKRRLRALMAIGWSRRLIATELGVTDSAIRQMLMRSQVRRTTAERVAAVYDRLSMTLPPDTFATMRTRVEAARHGHAPPLAWDDDTIDDPRARPLYGNSARSGGYDEAVVRRFVDGGERVRKLRHDEAQEAVRLLIQRGHSTWEIEHWYGLKPERYTKELAS